MLKKIMAVAAVSGLALTSAMAQTSTLQSVTDQLVPAGRICSGNARRRQRSGDARRQAPAPPHPARHTSSPRRHPISASRRSSRAPT